MDATLAGIIDVYQGTKNSRPQDLAVGWDDDEDEGISRSRWRTCVRDASWHPNAPIIVGI